MSLANNAESTQYCGTVGYIIYTLIFPSYWWASNGEDILGQQGHVSLVATCEHNNIILALLPC